MTASTAPVSDRKLRRRRALVGLALFLGAWAFFGALAGAAAADEGEHAGVPEWSAVTSTAWLGVPLTVGDAAAAGNADATASEPAITPVAPAYGGEIPDPPADAASVTAPPAAPVASAAVDPTAGPQAAPDTPDAPTTLDPTAGTQAAPVTPDESTTDAPTTDDLTTDDQATDEASTGELPADTSGLEPGLTDADLGTAPAAAPVAEASAPRLTTASAGGLRGSPPDRCDATGATARLISDPAAVGGEAMACRVGTMVDDGDGAGPCWEAIPQSREPSGPGQRVAANSADPATVADEPAETTAEAATPSLLPESPLLSEPDRSARPIQLPHAPLAPPVMPAAGTTAGGCTNSISAGAHHDASLPLGIVDADGAGQLTRGTVGVIASLTPDVTARAADPGSRPT